MELKLNSAYNTDCGIVIPRSHLKGEKGEKGERYAIFEVLTLGNARYTKKHVTFTTKELRRILNVGAKERIDIV